MTFYSYKFKLSNLFYSWVYPKNCFKLLKIARKYKEVRPCLNGSSGLSMRKSRMDRIQSKIHMTFMLLRMTENLLDSWVAR